MTTRTLRSRIGRCGAAGLAAAALALPMTIAGTAAAAQTDGPPEPAQQSSDTRVEVESGALDWGVRYSIRNYLENFGHTEGYVAAYDGAEYERSDTAARFSAVGGWADPENDEADLRFDGRLHMHGFGAPWLHFENVRLEVADQRATITVDMIESFGTRERTDGLVLAVFDFEGDDGVEKDGIVQEGNDGEIRIEADEGTFPEVIGAQHLPRMDGADTYGGDNAFTDGFILTLNDGEDDRDDDRPDPAPDPGPKDDEEDPVEVPGSEPHGESSATNRYGAELTVSPAYSLADEDQLVTLSGTGFPTAGRDGSSFGGLYVLFGWVDPEAGEDWGPGHGGASGHTFTYTQDIEPQGTYQSMVSYPGNTTVPGFPEMDANGDFEMEFPLMASRFESQQGMDIDCYRMQCGVILIGAHGQTNPEGEIFVPVYFTDTADGTGSDTPDRPGSEAPVANPNMVDAAGGPAGQNGGLGVNGGLVEAGSSEGIRTAMFGGLLLLSAGLLGAATLFRRGRLAEGAAVEGPHGPIIHPHGGRDL